MPYVDEMARHAIVEDCAVPQDAGELNFALTLVILDYMNTHGVSYATFNDISGAMTECLAEFRRRVVVPYEDVKALLNGDVYDIAIRQLQSTLQAQVDERRG